VNVKDNTAGLIKWDDLVAKMAKGNCISSISEEYGQKKKARSV
jgi:hypothetical protein